VMSLSEALGRELAPHGVRVTCICPGPVPTEFQARAGLDDKLHPLLTRSAARIARDGYDAFMAGRSLLVPGFANQVAAVLPRVLPRALVLRAVAAYQTKAAPPAAKPQRGD
jgi:uncharacterized protein